MKRRILYLLTPFIALIVVGSTLLPPPKAFAGSNNVVSACDSIVYNAEKSSLPSNFKASQVSTTSALSRFYDACKGGYNYAYSHPNINYDGSSTGYCPTNYNSEVTFCRRGYIQGQLDEKAGSTKPTQAQIDAKAKSLCDPYNTQNGVDSATKTSEFNACVTCYKAQVNGQDVTTIQENNYSGADQNACGQGVAAAQSGNAAQPGAAVNPVSTTTATTTTQPGSGAGTTSPVGCESSGYGFAWALCGLINGAANGADFIAGAVSNLLQIQPVNLTGSNDPSHTYEIWSQFRIYGDVILVIALLVIVFGESIGGGIIDAYTAKKVLPRLLIAAVLINLSIYLVAVAIDITNIIGNGISALLQTPFNSAINSPKQQFYVVQVHLSTAVNLGLTAAAGYGLYQIVTKIFSDPKVVAAGAKGGLVWILVIVVLPAFLIFMAILATVVLRRGLILFLLFVAPIAFALYCLPNTEKYFRQWWDALFKALLVYPIIMALFAMGNILSVTISSSTQGIVGIWATIIGVVCMLAPIALIPFSFKLAGGLLGRFHEFATQGAHMTAAGIHGNEKDPESLKNKVRRNWAGSRTDLGLSGREISSRLSRPGQLLSRQGRERRQERLMEVRASEMTRLGNEAAEAGKMFNTHKGSTKYLSVLIDGEEEARKKQADAAARGDTEEAAAWSSAIAAAQATPRAGGALKQAALQELSKTKFELPEDSQEAYNLTAERAARAVGLSEDDLIRDTAGNVTGARGARASAWRAQMNQAQFSLRQAGRWDLGGINEGSGLDRAAGLKKTSLYQLANSSPEAVRALVEDAGPGPVDLPHAVIYKELAAMKPNATGAVLEEINAQMASLEARGIEGAMGRVVATGPAQKTTVKYDRLNPAHSTWTDDEKTRGERIEMVIPRTTVGDEAQKEARTYERPRPENM